MSLCADFHFKDHHAVVLILRWKILISYYCYQAPAKSSQLPSPNHEEKAESIQIPLPSLPCRMFRRRIDSIRLICSIFGVQALAGYTDLTEEMIKQKKLGS